MNYERTAKPLAKYLSQVDVFAMAFGCMVGWGVFAMPGNTFLPVAGPAGTLIAMIIGMAIMLIIGNNLAYLMKRSSITGGIYSYTKEAFGRDHAFLGSWFLCLSYLTIVFLNGTALFYIIRILSGPAVMKGMHYSVAGNNIYLNEVIVSALVLGIIGVLFVFAKPLLQRLFTVLALILLVGIVIIAITCLPRAAANGAFVTFGSGGISAPYAIFSLIILAPWAFVGFEITSFDTAHFRFPLKKTKRTIFLAIIFAAFAYISMTLIAVAAYPDGFTSWQDYIRHFEGLSGVESVPTFYVARSILGSTGLVVMVITAIAAILTGIIGGYRAATRVLSTMAEDHILSAKFSETTFTILFIMAISIFLSFLGRNTLNWFVDLTSFGAIVAFGYASAAAWKVAKIEGNRQVAVTGMIGLLISCLFVIVQIVPRLSAMEAMGHEAFLLLSLWCLLGFIFYWRTITHSKLTEYSGLSTSGIVLFSLLIYSSLMWLAKLLISKESVAEIHSSLITGGIVVLLIIFAGLVIMLYVQDLIRTKHELAERDRIRAVESSLAKSQFLFNMSHDIRTPMNAIIGYTNLAMQEEIPPKVQDYLQKIDRSNHQLLDLINDILEMSRIESGKIELELEPNDLRSVFDDIRELFSEQMEQKHLDFNVQTSQLHNTFVWYDKKNLNRILLNIISNAYKFTPEGGTISASIWEIGDAEDGYGSYEIRVRDNGIGMSKEFADKMFSAFERERTSTVSGIEGTGLGLSITKSLVDLMGGTIDVLTAPGNGTEIIIRMKFRLAEGVADDAEPAGHEDLTAGGLERGMRNEHSKEQSDVHFTGRRLLLVEDNAINMEIALMILQQAGFDVETAENGKVAVDMVSASQPGYYEAILMDIQMPVMDGYEASRAIRSLTDPVLSAVPIVAMTANAFKEDEDAARDAGMQAHIAKPIDVDILLGTLSEILR